MLKQLSPLHLSTMSVCNSKILCMATARDSQGSILIAAGTGNRTVKVWDFSNESFHLLCSVQLEPSTSVPQALHFADDAQYVLVSGQWDRFMSVLAFRSMHFHLKHVCLLHSHTFAVQTGEMGRTRQLDRQK